MTAAREDRSGDRGDRGLGSWVTRRARMQRERPALVEGGQVTTYGELDERAVRTAHGLRARGVRRGERVAYLGLNSVDLVTCLLGTAKLGAVFVPLNTRLAGPELAAVLADAEPRLLVWTEPFAELVAAPEVAGLGLDTERLATGPGEHLDALLAADRDPLDEPIGLDDLAMIQYTSGTSGRPKGVRLSHGNVTWNVYNLLADVDVGTDEVALVTAPLFHTAALNQVLFPTLFKGGRCLIEPRFDAATALRLIETERVTLLFGVTSMYLAIMATPGFATADLSSLRSALTGGAPVPYDVLQTWADRGCPLFQGYGLTETSPGATMLRGEDALHRLGSAGAGVFFTEVRLRTAAGVPAAPGEPGEVQVRGPNVTDGYWRAPEATAAAFTADGWFRTGDLATADADGYLWIVDRLKDMYVSGGENVYPAEVERALHTHAGVAECAVVGVPDERWGEVGHAVVVRHRGARVTAEELLAHLDGRLARYKIPRSVEFVDELPHNAAGKLLRSVLREAHR